MSENTWRLCGSCKKPIELLAKYYACGISTCRKSAYCSMPCFDDHVAVFRHKDAWAEEKIAPKNLVPEEKSRIETNRLVQKPDGIPKDILIVASKLKDYVRAKSGMNTSATVLDRLSDMVRIQCDKAMQRAERENRKTIMDRDFYL
jgi:hypothetical protein